MISNSRSRTDSVDGLRFQRDMRLKENRPGNLYPLPQQDLSPKALRRYEKEQIALLPENLPPNLPMPAMRFPSPKAPREKAEVKVVKPPPRAGGGRGRAWKFKLPALPKMGSAFSLLLLAVVLSGHNGPLLQVSRILGSLASLGESAGHSASLALNASTAAVASAIELVLAAATNTLSI